MTLIDCRYSLFLSNHILGKQYLNYFADTQLTKVCVFIG